MWLLLALVIQTLFVLYALFSTGGAVTEVFAGMVPFPKAGFKWKMMGMLLLNLAASWLADQLAVYGWSALRGRRILGLTIL